MQQKNLFHVNVEEVKRLLEEANTPLKTRSRELLNAEQCMPTDISDRNELNDVIKFSRQVSTQVKECRAARLSDQSSFKAAIKIIDNFFSDFEKPLKSASERLALLIPVADQKLQKMTPNFDATEPIIQSEQDGPVISAHEGNSDEDIDFGWEIANIDQEVVDLEVLRNWFSNYAIKVAAQKYLRENGPREVRGIEYRRKAKF